MKMSKRFLFLIKWFTMALCGYLVVVFLSNTLWIYAGITAMSIILLMRWNPSQLNQRSSSNNELNESYQSYPSQYNPYFAINEILWKSIEVFNIHDNEHYKQGKLIVELCKDIIHLFASENIINDEFKYQDDFITIIIYYHKKDNQGYGVLESLRVFVPFLNDPVLEANKELYADNEPYVRINVLRPGSWINHVIGFKNEVQQLKDEANKKQEQARLLAQQLEQQKKFGRID
jgi:hypothetical protein